MTVKKDSPPSFTAEEREAAFNIFCPPVEEAPIMTVDGKRDETTRIEELEYLAGCLYQIIGQLADLAGVRDHPDVIRAMDNASDNAMTHKDLLPWPKTPLRSPPVPSVGEMPTEEEIARLIASKLRIEPYPNEDEHGYYIDGHREAARAVLAALPHPPEGGK